MRKAHGILLTALTALLAVPGVASAARRQATPAPAPAATPPAATPPPAGGNGSQSANAQSAAAGADFVITAERQVPDSFTLSTRAPLGYRLFEQPVHAIPEILNAVKRAPF